MLGTRHIPYIILAFLGVMAVLASVTALRKRPTFQASRFRRRCLYAGGLGLSALMFGSIALRSGRVADHFPTELVRMVGIAGLSMIAVVLVAWLTSMVVRIIPRPVSTHNPARRTFLTATRTAVMATPVAAAGYAVLVQRGDIRMSEVDLPVAGLPKELHGLRLVQISDIHLSPFLSEAELARAIDMANEARADLALVTGDLTTAAGDPIDACMRQLARLKAGSGVIGCLGNHEVYCKNEAYVALEGAKIGIDFLRSRSRVLRFRGQPVNFAGVDYQKMKSEYLEDAERLVAPGMPNILLSHNPDVIPTAARKGFDCTIAGHTHGGQINVEILHQNFNVARFYTPYTYGVYRVGNHHGYVTRGIGTVGLPARLGAPPEVALIRLCAT